MIPAALRPDLSPLRGSRGFRAVFVSRTVAVLGAQAAEVALLVQAKQLTGSPLVVGLLGIAELVPLLFFGLYGGSLADRFDRRILMRWCEPGMACCALVLLVNSLLPHPALWLLFVVAALLMAISSLQRPSFEAATPRLVTREGLTAAVALLSMVQNISFLIGSSLGGALAITPGPWLVYALDATGFAASFWILRGLPALPPKPASAGGAAAAGGHSGEGECDGESAGAGPVRPTVREMFAGIRYATTRKDLLGSYLADLSAMIFAYPNALFPFMAVTLHAPWSAGLMFAAPSAGGLLVSATSGWMSRVRRHGLAIALSAAIWGASIAAFGLSPDIYMALVCLLLAGAADECSGIFRDTLWFGTIPDHMRGRMAGVELLSYAGGPPLGQLRSGVMASVFSQRFSLAAGGFACVGAVGLVCASLPAFTRYVAAVPVNETAPAPATPC
ncbi:MAG TPA: MFS transporter [Trebonia sp.]|jgi:MFS family permease|nr:MFS transporter [Trebonia sp.]